MGINIKEHDVFKGCSDEVFEWCVDKFIEECCYLDKEAREKAEERFSLETDIVNNSGFFREFYITALLMKYAKSRRRMAVVQGMAAYSYVAYLLGITDINPIMAGYPMEMAFSYRKDRCPVMPLHIPLGFDEDILDYLKTMFGKGLVRKEGHCVILGDLTEQNEGCCTHTMEVPFFVDHMVSKADAMAALKGSRNYTEIFLSERKKVFQNMDMFNAGALDKDYESFVHAIAAARGQGVRPADKTGHKSEIFYTRDDVYRYGMKLFSGRSDLACELMDMVRKGRGRSRRIQDLLKEYGADEKTRKWLEGIQYLVSEGACIPVVQMMEYITGRKFRMLDTGQK